MNLRFLSNCMAITVLLCLSAPSANATGQRVPSRAQIDYAGFATLTDDLETVRAERLISLEQFQEMARAAGTIILDARSPRAYALGHISGAINLNFADFTAETLAQALGAPSTRILIYCNNNFINDVPPVVVKSLPLALNIATFINLHGYGYHNVYELGELVDSEDADVHWVRGAP